MQTVSRQAIAQGLASSMMYVAAIQSFVSPRVVEQAMTVLVAHVAAAFERERQIDLAALVSQVRPANGTSLSLGASPDSRYIQLHRGLSSVNIGVIVSGATHHLDQIDGVLQQLEVTFGYRDNGRFQLPWVPCYWFNLNGRCPHGTGCTYLHAKPPNYGCYDSEGRIVCQYHQWYSRGCPYPDCQWSHRPAVRLHRNQPAPGSDNSPQQRSLDATLDEQAIVHSSFALVLGHFASSTGVASPAQLPDTTWLRTLCDQDDRTAATLLLAFLLDHLQIRQSLGEGNYRHAMLVRAPKQVASERHSHWPEGIESEMPLVAVLVHRLDIVRTCRSSMSRTEPHDPHLLYPHLPRAIAGCPLLVFSAGYMYDPQFMSVRINRADRPSPATYKRLLSPELARVCNRSVPLEAIQAARRDFYQRHRSNIVAVSCGAPSRFIQEGSSNEEAIVVYVLLRGFIPIGEQALPRTFEHNGHTYRVKVCDGCYEPWSDFRDKCGISIAAVPQSLNLPEFQVGTDLDHQWRCGTLGTLGTAEFDDVVLDVAITNQHVVRPQVQDADGQWVTDNRSRVPIQSPCPKDAAAALDKLKQQVAQCNRDLEDDSEDEAAKQDRDRYSQELQELQSMVASEESYTLLGWAPIAHRGDFSGFGVDVGCIELTAEGKRQVAAGYRRTAKRVTGMESLFDRDGRLQVTAPSVRYFKIGSISGRTEGFLWQHGEDGFELVGFDQQMVSIRFRSDVMFEITLTDAGTKRAEASAGETDVPEVLSRQLLFVANEFSQNMGEKGDSGALVQRSSELEGEGPAVGLLHGGFYTLRGGRAAMACDIAASLHCIKDLYGERCRRVDLTIKRSRPEETSTAAGVDE